MIRDILKQFENLRVLVLGDVMLDTYIWEKVTRISPEAPVPVVMQTHSEQRMGGAANVALNIKSLGATPVMCSVIGKDENSKLFKELISNLEMPDEALIESSDRITTCKTRIIAGHQQLLRVDQEVDNYIDDDLEARLWQKIQSAITSGSISAIVFQDYDKGIITPNLITKTISLANSRNIPTLIDPKKRNFGYYQHATLFKPNYKELVEGLNLDVSKCDFDKLHDAAKIMQQKSGFNMVLITLSEYGMLICKDGEYRVVATEAREVSDVSGAGDTVIAMASLCLATGMDAYQMARLSNLAAGLVVEKIGVVPVEKTWLLETDFSW